MTNQIPDRPRIHSIITRSRFLHIEDALTPISPDKPGKVRFFIGEYRKGSGAQATAYHFLDDADARVIMADLGWGKAVDVKDYKGSANGERPISRVLTIQGPKDGKYWLQISMGPGEIIGKGAVKPAPGYEPDVEISIALTIHEARKMALAITEYMTAFRVVALIGTPRRKRPTGRPDAEVEYRTAPSQEPEDRELADHIGDEVGPEPEGPKEAKAPAEAKPATFYALANEAIQAGLLATVQELINASGSWREKTVKLQAAMAA